DIASGEVEWSDELYRIFGYEPRSRAVTFDSFVSAVLPDDHDRVLASIDDALAGAATYDMECRIVRPDGEVRTIHCCGEVVRDSGGQPLRMSGTALDITDRKRTELALQQREAHFRALIEHSSDVITVLNLDGTIRFESPSVERLLGYAQYELHGRSVFEFVHHEDLPAAREKFRLLIEQPGTHQLAEFRFRHKDGSWRNFEAIGRVIHDPDGRCSAIVNSRDITERKRTEAMLRTSQDKLRQALRASGTGLWEWNTETNDVVFSEEWKHQLGYEPTEIVDSFEAWTTLLHPEDRGATMRYIRGYVSHREGDYRQEFRLKHKDGEYRWIEARASFVTEADGRQIRILGSHTDITDRKRMEESIRESEEWYRTLVELSPSGVFVFSEGKTVYINPTGALLLGAKDPREILDRSTFDFIHPDYHQDVRRNVNRLLAGGVSVHSAERIYMKMDGTPIPVQVEAARITWNGKPAILGLFSDITERKQIEVERQRTLTLLTNVINATPDLIFVKDRDLRTMLCNNAFAQAVGKTPEEMIGRTDIENGWDPELAHGDPDKGIRGFEVDDRTALSGQVVHNPADPANVKGKVLIFDTFKIPLRNETGEVMGVLGVARDITTRLAMDVELKQSEARLHEAQRIARLGSWELDLTANRLSWSPETHRIFEIIEDQVDASYETFLSAVHPDDRSAVQRAYADSVRDKTPCEIVHRLLLPDGRVKYVQERCETIYDAQGAPQRSFGTVQDVTERIRLTEREAARSEQLKRLSELGLTLSGDPAEIFKRIVRIIGELFKVRVVCLSEIVGQELHFQAVYTNGQVVLNAGRCPLDVTPCATVEMDKDLRLYDRVMERFPQASFLQDHNAVSYCGFPSLDAYGQVVAVTCLLDDKPREFTQEDQELLRVFGQRIAVEVERARHLAERKAVEEALYRTTSMLSALIQSSPVGIITADREGRLTSWNPAAERIFGWTEQEVLGGQAPYLSPEDQEEAQVLWDLAIGGGNTRGLEIRRSRKDGSRIDIEFWGGALRDQAGMVTGAFGVINDITERKQAEQALQESEERFSKAFRTSPHPIWITEVATGRCIEVNDVCLQLFGFHREEVIGKTRLMLGIWPNIEDRVRGIERLKAGQPVRNMEFTLKIKSG
ncbi:MAG: PAS domain S-box protein, partial [Nitrospira sp.]|nr:PAS domain S-box protein [Nitrospira sp.]